jgi:glycosyltransferase involved in cell wall biosynthesis
MIIVAQLGARMHYAVAAILQRAGMLERLYTDIYAPRLPKPLHAFGARYGPTPFRRWLGRMPTDIPEEKITSLDAMGIEYYWRRRRAASPESSAEADLWAGRELCRRVIQNGLGNASAVFTYNSAGLELLRHARNAGKLAVVEQTIAAVRVQDELLKEEESVHHRWLPSCSRAPVRSAFVERDQMEWEASDLILCGSEFVRDSIQASGGPIKRCRVVPYGIATSSPAPRKSKGSRPLHVLTVGVVGLRKGAPYLPAVAKRLKGKAEFRMAGQVEVSAYGEELLREHVTLLGAVPRIEIQEQFAWADVFHFPSICEGSATACYEALAAGLPVITTPNAGSVVRDGVDGFIVPIRDPAANADKIERLADDSDLLAVMSANALERAADYTLEKYGERLIEALESCGMEHC